MKERKKSSIVWSISSEEFSHLIKESNNIAHLCKFFGMGIKGGNYNTIKRRILKENIDTSHFHNKKGEFNSGWISKEKFLSELKNTKKQNGWIKKKIIEFKLIEYICKECNLQPFWNNKCLVLHLDHVNGNRNDNALNNLRFLCPNCHSQTETYSMGQRKEKQYYCIDCNDKIKKKNVRCKKCGNIHRRKVMRPTDRELKELVDSNSLVFIGKKFGVSDNAIRKWCKDAQIFI